jgi:SAM-dependent methyltransferase
MKFMSYVLENREEVRRLEAQSNTHQYNFKSETAGFLAKASGPFLDAGCGSGILARYIGDAKSGAQVTGCDFSEVRLNGARELAAHHARVNFVQSNLTKLPFESNTYGGIVCRFVLEHLSGDDQLKAVREFYRCLKPGGWMCLIDLDGMYENLSPRPASTEELLDKVEGSPVIDLRVGRKLTQLAHKAGFTDVSHRIETMDFQGEDIEVERKLMSERLVHARPLIQEILGSAEKANQFEKDFLETMSTPGTILFYNKFIVLAQKPRHQFVSLPV